MFFTHLSQIFLMVFFLVITFFSFVPKNFPNIFFSTQILSVGPILPPAKSATRGGSPPLPPSLLRNCYVAAIKMFLIASIYIFFREFFKGSCDCIEYHRTFVNLTQNYNIKVCSILHVVAIMLFRKRKLIVILKVNICYCNIRGYFFLTFLIVFRVDAFSCCCHCNAYTRLLENHSDDFIIYILYKFLLQ